MPRAPKVLVIGMDAADKDLLAQWIAAGDLPALASLQRRGVCAPVKSPPGLGDDATWPSVYTGVSPARHGRYYYMQVFPGSYLSRAFTDADLKHEPFWNVLSRAGCNVAIIDVPKTPLPGVLNGIQLVDWSAHGHDHLETGSWPPSLCAEVTNRFGRWPEDLCDAHYLLSASETTRLVNELLASVAAKGALLGHVLEQGGWDLVMAVFRESHCVGHRAWHLHDAAHPRHDPALARSLGDPLKRVYMAIDAAIGTLLERVGPDTTVIVFSALGMAPQYTAQPLLDELLLRLDGAARRSGTTRVRSTWRKLPAGFRQRVRSLVPRASDPLRAVDHQQRRCFMVDNNDIAGAIRVNLRGREPHGQIQPGPEYDDFCATLTHDLLDLVNVDTGAPVVQEVLRTADLWRGTHRDCLPDLLAVWNRQTPIRAARSPKAGVVTACYVDYRSGNHVPDGVLYASGPTIAAGTHVAPIAVTTLAPTIAAMLDVALPDVDGVPVPELCGAPFT